MQRHASGHPTLEPHDLFRLPPEVCARRAALRVGAARHEMPLDIVVRQHHRRRLERPGIRHETQRIDVDQIVRGLPRESPHVRVHRGAVEPVDLVRVAV